MHYIVPDWKTAPRCAPIKVCVWAQSSTYHIFKKAGNNFDEHCKRHCPVITTWTHAEVGEYPELWMTDMEMRHGNEAELH